MERWSCSTTPTREAESEILDAWERDEGFTFDRRRAERIAVGRRAQA